MSMAKMVMGKFYRQAQGRPERLPWHREEPGPLLAATVDDPAAKPGRRALDLGCGAGVFSAWMAKRGLDVTGLDLFPEAIAMAEARAKAQDVIVKLVSGNLLEFRPAQRFDVVYDSGCLHSLVDVGVDAYKRKLLDWLELGGTYVLEHWGKRHLLDFRPIGPKRRSEATIRASFAPS
jgi:cyclopropane fatty-acyl-phospholipid synthase-like methyltransferase